MASPKVKSLLRDNKIDEIDFFSHRSFKASSKTRRNAKFSSKKIKKTKRVKGYCISESFQMKDLFSFLATVNLFTFRFFFSLILQTFFKK